MIRFLIRTVLIWGAACATLQTVLFLMGLLTSGVWVSRASLSLRTCLILFTIVMLLDVAIWALQRLHEQSNGADGLPPSIRLLGYSFPIDYSAKIVAFLLGAVVLYFPVSHGTQSQVVSINEKYSTPVPTATPRPTAAAFKRSSNAPVSQLHSTPLPEGEIIDGHVISIVDLPKLQYHFCDGLTTLRCRKAEDAFKPLWIKWTGKVTDIDSDLELAMYVKFPDSSEAEGDYILPTFNDSEKAEIAQVRVGDVISIVGKVSEPLIFAPTDAIILRNLTAEARQ